MRIEQLLYAGVAPTAPLAANATATLLGPKDRSWTTITKPALAAPASFAAVVAEVADVHGPQDVAAKAVAIGPVAASAKSITKTQRAFEAVTLQVFVEFMLPDERSKLFGTGAAGKMWKSLFSERLAEAIAASDRLRLLPERTFGAAAQADHLASPMAALPSAPASGALLPAAKTSGETG